MDSRDLIVLGLVGVGGWLFWRWVKAQPIDNAQQTVPSTTAGMVASDMTSDAARTTLFGGGIVTRRVFGAIPLRVPQLKLPAPTAPPAAILRQQAKTYPLAQAQALIAAFSPDPVTPSNSARHYTSTGVLGVQSTMPSGDQPQPGDPSPQSILTTRAIA